MSEKSKLCDAKRRKRKKERRRNGWKEGRGRKGEKERKCVREWRDRVLYASCRGSVIIFVRS